MKPTFKVTCVVNNQAGEWTSWDAKIAAVKAFYAPVCTLDVTLVKTSLTPRFTPFEPGIYQIDPTWYQQNVIPLATGADIVVFVVPPSDHTVPCLCGLEAGKPLGIWQTTVYADETSHNYAAGIDLGNNCEIIIEHELSHAFYAMLSGVNGGTEDHTHKYFYSGNPAGVLADFSFSQTISLYQQLVAVLTKLIAFLKQPMPSNDPVAQNPAPEATQTPNPDTLLSWEFNKPGSENNRHNVRVLCDLGGLSDTPTEKVRMPDGEIQLWSQKDILTACVRLESNFDTNAHNANPNSTDWGICQYNDNPKNGWIGTGCVFPSAAYVLDNPEPDVKEMVAYYKQTGNLNPWVSFSGGGYRQYLGTV